MFFLERSVEQNRSRKKCWFMSSICFSPIFSCLCKYVFPEWWWNVFGFIQSVKNISDLTEVNLGLLRSAQKTW